MTFTTSLSRLTAPPSAPAPVVRIRRKWADEWLLPGGLFALQGSAHSAGADLGSMSFRRRYGDVLPLGSATASQFRVVEPMDLRGWWVRVDLMVDTDEIPIWVGRFSSQTRNVFGDSNKPAGMEELVAYEPLQELHRQHIANSFWYDSNTNDFDIGWVPDMNPLDDRNLQVGNRSAARFNFDDPTDPAQGTYEYGDNELWTRFDALEYILRNFVDRGWDDGPNWRIGGQADVLALLTDTISFRNTQTAAEVLRRIIPPEIGLDWRIRFVPAPSDTAEDEFEIFVFALRSQETTFLGATLPANPNIVNITTTAAELDFIRLVQTRDNRYSKIRVLGARIIVCCSLGGGDLNPGGGLGWEGQLIPAWTAALQNDYKAGAGPGADAVDHDAARLNDRFRPVWQLFAAWPNTWDFNQGFAAPVVDLEGEVQPPQQSADRQQSIRRTLSWIPLREGIDYSSTPPVNNNPSGRRTAFLPPAVWLFGPPPVEEGQAVPSPRWFPVEEAGIGVSSLNKDFGVLLSGKPNHILALDRFGGAAPTNSAPIYNYDDLIVTLAFESDQRLILGADLELGPDDVDPGGTLYIDMPELQLWFLAPYTMIGVTDTGLGRFSGPDGQVLRNDTGRMALAVAGAIARYLEDRNRAEIHTRGLFTWSNLIGHIVAVVESGEAGSFEIDAPITAVEWDFVAATTTIRTGFAS